MERKTITAKEIVKQFNIPYYTVNYYTAIGLLPVVVKRSNQRMYDEDVIRHRVQKIQKLIEEGYPLNLIKKKLTEGKKG